MLQLKLIECPRDAMQGLSGFIPTKDKIRYINALLKVGFHTLDMGSFVSPKAVPQMRDTAEVLDGLLHGNQGTKLLVIAANERGAEAAADFDEISYLGFPLSVSETFQQRNTNKSIDRALDSLATIQDVCEDNDKLLIAYLSMGFGNPYGESYHPDMLINHIERLDQLAVSTISLSDTVGSATPELIEQVFSTVIPKFPHIEFGAHFHTKANGASEKISAAWRAGCRRFDGALGGLGGCPFADDKLTGNMPTESLIAFAAGSGILPNSLDQSALESAQNIRKEIMG